MSDTHRKAFTILQSWLTDSSLNSVNSSNPVNLIQNRTRKSFCVNARGIPTAAYQVLHLGYPSGQVRWGYPRWGTPWQEYPQARSDGGGTRGEVPPGQVRWGYPRWGTPWQEYPQARSDGGVPEVRYPSGRGTPPARSDRGPEVGYPRQGTPSAGPCLGTLQAGPGRGTLPPPEMWTDRHL